MKTERTSNKSHKGGVAARNRYIEARASELKEYSAALDAAGMSNGLARKSEDPPMSEVNTVRGFSLHHNSASLKWEVYHHSTLLFTSFFRGEALDAYQELVQKAIKQESLSDTAKHSSARLRGSLAGAKRKKKGVN